MKAEVTWVDGMRFIGQADSGHPVVMDGPPEAGGRGAGVRPMELLAIGVGGCTAFDVVMILKKARQAVAGCTVEVTAERADEPPRVFTSLHIQYTITGTDLSTKQVERAVKLSAEKYCSASLMLGQAVPISHGFTVRAPTERRDA